MKFNFSDFVRAVYLDFEGNTDRPPSFVGVLYDEHFEQVIFENTFHSVFATYEPRHHTSPRGYSAHVSHPGRVALGKSTLDAFTRQLVRQCQAQDRRLVGWSQYENGLREPALTVTGHFGSRIEEQHHAA